MFRDLLLTSLAVILFTIPFTPAEVYAQPTPSSTTLDTIALDYVKLALAFWQQYDAYIDTYIGPDDWKNRAKADKKSLAEIKQQASVLLTSLHKLNLSRQFFLILMVYYVSVWT